MELDSNKNSVKLVDIKDSRLCQKGHFNNISALPIKKFTPLDAK